MPDALAHRFLVSVDSFSDQVDLIVLSLVVELAMRLSFTYRHYAAAMVRTCDKRAAAVVS